MKRLELPKDKSNILSVVLLLLVQFLFSCNQESTVLGPKYERAKTGSGQLACRFAVHPLYNPAKLSQAYQPLIDYLNKNVPNAGFVLEASRDYATFEEKILEGELEFLLPNPWQTIEAMKQGYEVIAMAGEPQDFKGIFVVRKNDGITKPSDLKGKAVSYPAQTALAACMMPQYFLHSHGININKDIENRYVGSQESAIMNVFLNETAAAGTWPPPWRAFQKDHPLEAEELHVIWETPSLINNSVMVKKNLPIHIKNLVRNNLLDLQKSADGQAILAGMETAGFCEATDKDYDVVRDFISRFEREIRPVKQQ